MRWMALLAVGVAPLMLFVGTSCEDSGGETTAAGGSGAGGAGGATTTTSSTSTGSPDCHGDPAAWADVQKSNIPCTNNSDCCVVFNSCTAAGQVVGTDDFPGAADVWPWCDDECVMCMFPLIEVECVDQHCVGYEIPLSEDAGMELGAPHCGEDDVVLQLPGPAMAFPCL
ncbi:MAG: hypothetical protein JRI68_05530 [Deltaproteobacteria bacterium]|nr:hypothetical protein [Deltaproteobacteria bacterium]